MVDHDQPPHGIQDEFLKFCAARAMAAMEAGDYEAAHEWWEGIGLFMGPHWKRMEFYANLGRTTDQLWGDNFAANILSPIWATNNRMLDGAQVPSAGARVAHEIRAWIETSWPAAVPEATALDDELKRVEGQRMQVPQGLGGTKLRDA